MIMELWVFFFVHTSILTKLYHPKKKKTSVDFEPIIISIEFSVFCWKIKENPKEIRRTFLERCVTIWECYLWPKKDFGGKKKNRFDENPTFLLEPILGQKPKVI